MEEVTQLLLLLWLLYIQKLQHAHFPFECFSSVATNDNFLVSFGILQNTYSMKQPDLYYFETIKMTSQA